MGEIVNLRRARKTRARSVETAKAAANRTKFGLGAAERANAETSRAMESRRFEAHKRDARESASGDHGD